MTDYDPIALEMAELNVKLNNLSHCVKVWQQSVWQGLPELAPQRLVQNRDCPLL